MQLIVSFDYGQKKIGLAVGNDLLKTAQELVTINCKNGIPDWLLVDNIIDEWTPDLLLLGLPLHSDGTQSKLSKQVRLFGNQLGKRYKLPVEYENEHLSSNEADKLLRESLQPKQGLSKKKQLKRDQVAARLILESYFARHG